MAVNVGQVSSKLRRATDGYTHWCPGCHEMHWIPDGWTFDGNLERPSFSPSVKITGKQAVVDAQGEWHGEWKRGPDGRSLDGCCHYVLTTGILNFCNDCTHALNNHAVPLPVLPPFLRDDVIDPQRAANVDRLPDRAMPPRLVAPGPVRVPSRPIVARRLVYGRNAA